MRPGLQDSIYLSGHCYRILFEAACAASTGSRRDLRSARCDHAVSALCYCDFPGVDNTRPGPCAGTMRRILLSCAVSYCISRYTR